MLAHNDIHMGTTLLDTTHSETCVFSKVLSSFEKGLIGQPCAVDMLLWLFLFVFSIIATA